MAEQTKKNELVKSNEPDSLSVYLDNFSVFVTQLCSGYLSQIGVDNSDERENLKIFCDMLTSSAQSVEKEMLGIRATLDQDSRNLLNRHVDNSGIIGIQAAAIQLLKGNKKKSKIELIIEIIKKVGLQLIELLQELFNLPAWVEKILKIIVALFEIIDNVLPLILELLGIDALFMKNAEKNLLEFHPKWKNLRATIVLKNG